MRLLEGELRQGALEGLMQDAIAREKQLKAGSRQRKLELIREHNPLWQDLAAEQQH